MAGQVLSVAGDTVDLICRRQYGDESGFVEAVLNANPGLAGLGPILPVGTPVRLPDLPDRPQASVEIVTLY
ncbi:tail protein X [Loktanella sp. 3ANDIMAR09]|uniref:tail protein X n=1 Tax=Loktanella sp. 3ANDIMAR09 TaxID=1225657 RepID=UPI0006F87C5E|nr:tail protein X [Loktanella sp. 3ANDIMAR09]